MAAAAMAPRKLLTAAFIGLCLPLGLAAGTITPPGGASEEPAHIARMPDKQTSWLDAALPLAFLLLVLPLGLILGGITPPGEVPDEAAHVVRAAALWHGALIGKREQIALPDGQNVAVAGVAADPALIWACSGPAPPPAGAIARKMRLAWTGRRPFLAISPVAIYAPVFYLPAALGLGIARMFGASPYFAIDTARLAMFAGFAALGLAALLLARRGQALIFLALSLPMTLSLGASCNPDGLLIATSCLAAALISRGKATAGAVCLACVILTKPPYALLAAMLWVPLRAPRREIYLRLALTALAVLPGALWLAYALSFSSAPVIRPDYHPGPLFPGDPRTIFHSTDAAAQWRGVVAHPFWFLRIFLHSLTPGLADQAIGVLGWLEILLPPPLYALWLAAAAGALMACMLEGRAPGPRPAGTLLLLAGIAGSVLLIWLSQYLVWTDIGATEIEGPTGRYLLPLIPMLGLALPDLRLPGANWLRGAALCLPVLAVLATMLVLPRELAIAFYLS